MIALENKQSIYFPIMTECTDNSMTISAIAADDSQYRLLRGNNC